MAVALQQAGGAAEVVRRAVPRRDGTRRPGCGHSLAAGMHVVAEEMPAPICKEFARVYDEQNLGIPLEEASKGMCDRVPNLDLRFFVTSVAIQRQTGGDLAEILDRIGHVIRERFKILGQVKRADGRRAAVRHRPDRPADRPVPADALDEARLHPLLWKDPMGIKMSIGAIILVLIGAYAIKKIVDIKV